MSRGVSKARRPATLEFRLPQLRVPRARDIVGARNISARGGGAIAWTFTGPARLRTAPKTGKSLVVHLPPPTNRVRRIPATNEDQATWQTFLEGALGLCRQR